MTPGARQDLANIRDLGGLPSIHGETLFGRLYRSMSPDQLTNAGWQQLLDSGIRTLVDLRNDDEITDTVARPAVLTVVRRPIEDHSDADFMDLWEGRLGSPGYYADVLDRWPGLVGAAVASISDALGTGVLVHCAAGRDRTGMIIALVLHLVGVDRDAIIDDYEASVRDFNDWLRIRDHRERPRSDDELHNHLLQARDELVRFLDATDAEGYLLGAGLSLGQISRIRSELLG